MKASYIPKGGMCRVCKHKCNDCSSLEFEKMPVHKAINESITVVICTEFKRDKL